MNLSEMTLEDMKKWLNSWAGTNKCIFMEKGEVGFGRPCVGMMVGNHYLDYSSHMDRPPWDEVPKWAEVNYIVRSNSPENAYHKHDCIAVLVIGEDYDEAIKELLSWMVAIEEAGLTVGIVERNPEHVIDALFHGFTTPRLVKREL